MKWTRGQGASDVEDLRGQSAAGGGGGRGTALKLGGGGAVVAIIVALLSQVLGVDLGGGSSSNAPAGAPGPSRGVGADSPRGGTPIDPATDPDAELKDFVSFIIKDVQDTFAQKVPGYRRAKLVLFTDAVDTGCGLSSSAIGPFYCPPDEKAYIDLTFYRDLKQRFDAPGDFAQAYVLAHEIGHHVQNLVGTDAKVARARTGNEARDNAMSVKVELQADCYAGVWANSAKARDLLEMGDAEEALKAATEIGDDRLQKRAGMTVNRETFTHGSSAERVRWFQRGMASGRLEDCDTFGGQAP